MIELLILMVIISKPWIAVLGFIGICFLCNLMYPID